MKIFEAFLAMILSIFPAFATGGAVSDRLEGTWTETRQYKDYPRAVLHFEGQNLRLEHVFDEDVTVEYKVSEQKDPDDFTITFEYWHKVKRGNGRIIDRKESRDYRYHVENGRPILSEMVFEYDGRGLIVFGEFLRKENFTDGFESELKKKLNNREAVPTMMKME